MRFVAAIFVSLFFSVAAHSEPIALPDCSFSVTMPEQIASQIPIVNDVKAVQKITGDSDEEVAGFENDYTLYWVGEAYKRESGTLEALLNCGSSHHKSMLAGPRVAKIVCSTIRNSAGPRGECRYGRKDGFLYRWTVMEAEELDGVMFELWGVGKRDYVNIRIFVMPDDYELGVNHMKQVLKDLYTNEPLDAKFLDGFAQEEG